MVLRATGGLMTMLTAPGAGTNTETGSAHQDAFDDLAAAEAEEIAAVLQESLFAPALDQWHPGQPHLVEFAMRRPDSDNATGTIANVASLATAGYRTDAAQVSDLTGLAVQDTGAPAAAAQPTPGGDFPALRSLHTRFAPTMLYPPARAAFDRAINSRLAPSTPSPDSSAPLTQAELEALQSLSKGFDPDQLKADANTIYTALADAITPSEEPDPTAENSCNQYKHEPGCNGGSSTTEKKETSLEGKERKSEGRKTEKKTAEIHSDKQHEQKETDKQPKKEKKSKKEALEEVSATPAGKSIRDTLDKLSKRADGDEPSHQHIGFKQVEPKTAAKVTEFYGGDYSDYEHSIAEKDIQHAKQHHPDLTDEDFMLIPDITANWDDLIKRPSKKKGNRIRYIKNYGNTTYILAERVGSRKKDNPRLMFTTIFFRKKTN